MAKIYLGHISGKRHPADGTTKGLGKTNHEKFVNYLCLGATDEGFDRVEGFIAVRTHGDEAVLPLPDDGDEEDEVENLTACVAEQITATHYAVRGAVAVLTTLLQTKIEQQQAAEPECPPCPECPEVNTMNVFLQGAFAGVSTTISLASLMLCCRRRHQKKVEEMKNSGDQTTVTAMQPGKFKEMKSVTYTSTKSLKKKDLVSGFYTDYTRLYNSESAAAAAVSAPAAAVSAPAAAAAPQVFSMASSSSSSASAAAVNRPLFQGYRRGGATHRSWSTTAHSQMLNDTDGSWEHF